MPAEDLTAFRAGDQRKLDVGAGQIKLAEAPCLEDLAALGLVRARAGGVDENLLRRHFQDGVLLGEFHQRDGIGLASVRVSTGDEFARLFARIAAGALAVPLPAIGGVDEGVAHVHRAGDILRYFRLLHSAEDHRAVGGDDLALVVFDQNPLLARRGVVPLPVYALVGVQRLEQAVEAFALLLQRKNLFVQLVHLLQRFHRSRLVGVGDIEQLEAAQRTGRVREFARFGVKAPCFALGDCLAAGLAVEFLRMNV